MSKRPSVFQMKHIENIECFNVSSRSRNTDLKHIDFIECFRVSVFPPYGGERGAKHRARFPSTVGGVA